MWVLLGVVIGFLLPMCACAVMTTTFLVSAGITGGFTASDPVGVGAAVAIIRVEGTIVASDNTSFSTSATSATIIADLKAAEADPDVKAIVLRIDSPGGSVTGSAQIHEQIERMEKPVIVSMASVAASGGYYISAPADYIFARPDTLTGSLGVILSFFNAEDLLTELGIEEVAITSGPNKNLGSPFADPTLEQLAILQATVNESYEEFVRVIVSGRGLSQDKVRELADGRIYTGRQALKNGLVDELGDLTAAISKAAELGGISGEPRIIEYDHAPSLQDFLVGFNLRLNQTEADVALKSFYELTTPRLEYRYLGTPPSE